MPPSLAQSGKTLLNAAMPKFLTLRTAIIATLFLLFLVAGAIGGGAFLPDVSAIRELQEARVEAPRVTMVAIGLTHFGSAWATLGGGLLVALWLALRVDRRRGMILAAAVIGERVMLDGLKLLLDRARPALDAHPVVTHSSSFPSGHSGNSMAVFLAIALIAVPERWRRAGGDHRHLLERADRADPPLSWRALAERRRRRLVAWRDRSR